MRKSQLGDRPEADHRVAPAQARVVVLVALDGEAERRIDRDRGVQVLDEELDPQPHPAMLRAQQPQAELGPEQRQRATSPTCSPKPRLPDRVQAVVYAYETGLVRPGAG
jgi:hypothetical protein